MQHPGIDLRKMCESDGGRLPYFAVVARIDNVVEVIFESFLVFR